MKFLALTALLLSSLSLSAFGAQESSRCASADGSVQIIEGKFFEKGEVVPFPYLLVSNRRLVHRERKACRLVRADRDVIAHDLRVFEQRVVYSNGDTREAELRCEERIQGIPAGDACAE